MQRKVLNLFPTRTKPHTLSKKVSRVRRRTTPATGTRRSLAVYDKKTRNVTQSLFVSLNCRSLEVVHTINFFLYIVSKRPKINRHSICIETSALDSTKKTFFCRMNIYFSSFSSQLWEIGGSALVLSSFNHL